MASQVNETSPATTAHWGAWNIVEWPHRRNAAVIRSQSMAILLADYSWSIVTMNTRSPQTPSENSTRQCTTFCRKPSTYCQKTCHENHKQYCPLTILECNCWLESGNILWQQQSQCRPKQVSQWMWKRGEEKQGRCQGWIDSKACCLAARGEGRHSVQPCGFSKKKLKWKNFRCKLR